MEAAAKRARLDWAESSEALGILRFSATSVRSSAGSDESERGSSSSPEAIAPGASEAGRCVATCSADCAPDVIALFELCPSSAAAADGGLTTGAAAGESASGVAPVTAAHAEVSNEKVCGEVAAVGVAGSS